MEPRLTPALLLFLLLLESALLRLESPDRVDQRAVETTRVRVDNRPTVAVEVDRIPSLEPGQMYLGYVEKLELHPPPLNRSLWPALRVGDTQEPGGRLVLDDPLIDRHAASTSSGPTCGLSSSSTRTTSSTLTNRPGP